MTRTVEMARLWPMPGDEWHKGGMIRTVQKVVDWYVEGLCVEFKEPVGYMKIPAFRRWVADATPVRIFEGTV